MRSRSIAASGIASGLVLLGHLTASCGSDTTTATTVITSSPAHPAASPLAASVQVTIDVGAAGKGPAAFGANPVTVLQGTTVTWTNVDTMSHTVTADDVSFNSGVLAPGQSFSHTFDQPGIFTYYCAIHGRASMSGAVQVDPSP